MKPVAPPLPQRPARNRPARGFALMMTLVVVLLATTYISEFFLSSGLELRSMRTFRDAEAARGMARLAFKALQTGLLTSQAEVLRGVAELQGAGGLLAIPWQGGLLTELKVEPLDHLFNINELSAPRPGTAPEIARALLFRNVLEAVEIPPEEAGLQSIPVGREAAGAFYAALVDWVDADDQEYVGRFGGAGAEQAAYLGEDPEVAVKNARLDQLSEIRLVRGVAASRIPWASWEARFAALPTTSKTNLYPGRLNVNLAGAGEIRTFLENRRLDDPGLLGDANASLIQEAINVYADNPDEIIAVLIPEEGERPSFTSTTLREALTRVPAIGQDFNKYFSELFTTDTEYFRVTILADMNDVQARLRAVLRIPASGGKAGRGLEVLQFSLQ